MVHQKPHPLNGRTYCRVHVLSSFLFGCSVHVHLSSQPEAEFLNFEENVPENPPIWKASYSPILNNGWKDNFSPLAKTISHAQWNLKKTEHVHCAVDLHIWKGGSAVILECKWAYASKDAFSAHSCHLGYPWTLVLCNGSWATFS
jgi:hypothetical protein